VHEAAFLREIRNRQPSHGVHRQQGPKRLMLASDAQRTTQDGFLCFYPIDVPGV
jgi:hypothetical protein